MQRTTRHTAVSADEVKTHACKGENTFAESCVDDTALASAALFWSSLDCSDAAAILASCILSSAAAAAASACFLALAVTACIA